MIALVLFKPNFNFQSKLIPLITTRWRLRITNDIVCGNARRLNENFPRIKSNFHRLHRQNCTLSALEGLPRALLLSKIAVLLAIDRGRQCRVAIYRTSADCCWPNRYCKLFLPPHKSNIPLFSF